MTTTAYTVYPRGWFEGRSGGGAGRAKMHAVLLEQEPVRGRMVHALCGAYGEAVRSPFKAREGNAITCSRCAGKLAKQEAQHA